MMPVIRAIGKKTLNDSIKNSWLVSMTIMFFGLSYLVVFWGGAPQGKTGVAELTTTISSLSALAMFMVPLAAILLCYDSFVGERESGNLALLLTYPVRYKDIILGKLCGHSIVMTVIVMFGFGTTGVMYVMDLEPLARYSSLVAFGHLIVSSLLLANIFISIAYFVSLIASEKAKALVLLLAIWFVAVLVYDLLLFIIVVKFADPVSNTLIQALILLNPADLFRMINLLALDGQSLPIFNQMVENYHWLNLEICYLILVFWSLMLCFGCQQCLARKSL
jgi:Cu-processing system permease protein